MIERSIAVAAKNETNFMVNELKHVEKGTCIRFQRRKQEKDYIRTTNALGCYANFGKVGK